MKIKLKSFNSTGSTRSDNEVVIREVMVNEDFLHADNESIAIGFRNKDTSGVIEFSAKEFDKFANSVKRKLHLVKSVKAFGREGAINMERSR